jgi:hypothetical protein
MKPSSPVHLWIYNHPFYGISDQIEFFLLIMRQNGYRVTIGRQPRSDALNVVIENFSAAMSNILIDFCGSQRKRVAIIMTEHLDFIEDQIFIHGDPLWRKNDYMHPVTQVARIKNLMDCIQYVRCFFVLGDLPELYGFSKMFPGLPVRALPFPRLEAVLRSDPAQRDAMKYDAVFSGYVTNYRGELLDSLSRELSVACPRKFVSRKMRDRLNCSGKIVLNLPQRQGWRWLSLMRVIAALRCGRATVSLGTADDSKTSACCPQLDITKADWIGQLKHYVDNWEAAYLQAFENYSGMAINYEQDKKFPHDIFEYWDVTDGACASR